MSEARDLLQRLCRGEFVCVGCGGSCAEVARKAAADLSERKRINRVVLIKPNTQELISQIAALKELESAECEVFIFSSDELAALSPLARYACVITGRALMRYL